MGLMRERTRAKDTLSVDPLILCFCSSFHSPSLLHLPPLASTCLHLPPLAFTCLHLPSLVFTCLHLPSLAFTCLHLPSLAFTCLLHLSLLLLPPSLVSTAISSFTCLHLPLLLFPPRHLILRPQRQGPWDSGVRADE